VFWLWRWSFSAPAWPQSWHHQNLQNNKPAAAPQTGVLVIETKGRSKPVNDGAKQFKVRVENDALYFPNHVETEPLEQVRRNVTSVRNWLNSATGNDVPVGGILVLPGWFVDLRQKSISPYVVNPSALPKLLHQFRVGTLEISQIQAIAYQVEQKVRDVAK
jgi:hypothetical protein